MKFTVKTNFGLSPRHTPGTSKVTQSYEIYNQNSSWPLPLTRTEELKSHSIIRTLQWKLILESPPNTHDGSEKSLDHMKITVKTQLGHPLWHVPGCCKVTQSYDNHNENSSWPLALTHTKQLRSHLIIWDLPSKLIWATRSDTRQGPEKSLDHMKFTMKTNLGRGPWHAVGTWKVTQSIWKLQ